MATCEIIPIVDLRVGDRIAGGEVTGVRRSKSGKTVFVTYVRADGSSSTYSQDARTRCARFE
jgi:hypothetical protein